jgi:ABC-2 type transport system permease protein
VAIAWSQILLGALAAVAFVGMPAPTNVVLMLAAIAGGTGVFVLLAMASTAWTPSVRMAEVTTTPVLVISMTMSGLMFPLRELPVPLQWLAQVMPLTPVVDLMRLGLTGTTPDGDTVASAASFGSAAVPAIILAGWLGAGAWTARRWFRWEPRR